MGGGAPIPSVEDRVGRDDELILDDALEAPDAAAPRTTALIDGAHSATYTEPLTPDAASATPKPAPAAGTFQPGRAVRIYRVRTRDHGQRIGEVGRGRLLEAATVGRPARLAVGSGPALITSPVRQVTPLSPRLLQLTTQNSVYRIELIA